MHVQLRLVVGIGRAILSSKNNIHLGDVEKAYATLFCTSPNT
jgi:hypothetical protein